MRKLRCNVVAVAALLVASLSYSVALAKDEPVKVAVEPKTTRNDVSKIVNASRAVKEISAIPKRKIPPVVLKEAGAVVIVPKAFKNAFMVSGGKTGGVLLLRDKDGGWSSPVFINISGGTLGWQIVGDPMDIFLLFKNSKHIDAILKGKLTLDAKVKIAPGWVALTLKGASKEELGAEIASYVLSHGVFVEEAVVAGTTLQNDAAANDAFYGKPKIDAGDILSGKVTKSSEEVTALQKQLTDYAAVK